MADLVWQCFRLRRRVYVLLLFVRLGLALLLRLLLQQHRALGQLIFLAPALQNVLTLLFKAGERLRLVVCLLRVRLLRGCRGAFLFLSDGSCLLKVIPLALDAQFGVLRSVAH